MPSSLQYLTQSTLRTERTTLQLWPNGGKTFKAKDQNNKEIDTRGVTPKSNIIQNMGNLFKLAGGPRLNFKHQLVTVC